MVQPGGRERLRQSFFAVSRGQAVAGVLLAVVGFGAVTQVRSNELDNTYAGYREQDLIDVLNGLSGASERAETERARLQRTLSDLRSVNSRRQAALAEARKSLDSYNILAGLVPVTGPGIRLTITPADGQPSIDSMVDLVQELRNAGAEAIGVNDKVRLVAGSAVEPTAGGFSFGGQELEAPYVVDVIGDPSTLRAGISFLRGPLDQFEEDGVHVGVKEFSSLDVSEVRQPVKPEFAQPDG
jgi:uncharacterized protein YlxW (UPF0749 family)